MRHNRICLWNTGFYSPGIRRSCERHLLRLRLWFSSSLVTKQAHSSSADLRTTRTRLVLPANEENFPLSCLSSAPRGCSWAAQPFHIHLHSVLGVLAENGQEGGREKGRWRSVETTFDGFLSWILKSIWNISKTYQTRFQPLCVCVCPSIFSYSHVQRWIQ